MIEAQVGVTCIKVVLPTPESPTMTTFAGGPSMRGPAPPPPPPAADARGALPALRDASLGRRPRAVWAGGVSAGGASGTSRGGGGGGLSTEKRRTPSCEPKWPSPPSPPRVRSPKWAAKPNESLRGRA